MREWFNEYSCICCQIDVAINAPKAGKIVEVLAKEEDTVSVGQDLYVLEAGEPGEGEFTL
jgi:pyruvate/2-oxoglutarate dehydrogenase complex dihydrolipoamide acyltransferase (E2) component